MGTTLSAGRIAVRRLFRLGRGWRVPRRRRSRTRSGRIARWRTSERSSRRTVRSPASRRSARPPTPCSTWRRRDTAHEAAAIAFLRRQVRAGHVTTVGLAAKVVMAAVAAGRDPSTFAGTNLARPHHRRRASERPVRRRDRLRSGAGDPGDRAAGQTPDAAAVDVAWRTRSAPTAAGSSTDRIARARIGTATT